MVSALLLVLAGIGAGLLASTAGLASLISYPALLAVGLSPVSANVTNTVGLVFNSIGSVSSSAPELRGRWPSALRLAAVAAAGGVAGSAVLLLAPRDSFQRVVPVLIALASIAILIRPRAGRGPAQARLMTPRRTRRLTVLGVFLIGAYGGYFGAAAGVLMLALFAQRFVDLPVANAMKNVVVGTANAVAAVVYAVLAPVRWFAVLFLGAGLLLGGSLGPLIVRRVDPRVIRAGVAVGGLTLAVVLALRG